MTTRLRLRRTLTAAALSPVLALATLGPAAALDPPTVNDPAVEVATDNGDLFASPCPEMTDSVYRLYRAFFGREPDAVGWQYWMEVYVAPTTNLETIANDFVLSDEFRATYGPLSNGDFVRLVYNNVMGREPDQAGYDHWVGSLDTGYSRGAVMIAFSESAEYVALTDTWPPLAGYLQWYGRPLQFACGNGPVIVTPEQQTAFADLMIWNDAGEPVSYRMGVETPGGTLMDDYHQLDASSYSIYWNMEIAVIGGRSLIIELPDRNDVFWTAVFYDAPHAPDRSPYTDGFGVFARTGAPVDDASSLLAAVDGGAEIGFADWGR
ncbi:MAG: DUF4214 domain-containing protein [Acidimicrobiales bacterium]